MILIATHNSGTGEPSKGWFSRLVLPFSKCQSLTLEDQFLYGCRFFDLRTKQVEGKYVLAHGLWHSKTTLIQALEILNSLSHKYPSYPTFIMITYEGSLSSSEVHNFKSDMTYMTRHLRLRLVSLSVKLPVWKTLKSTENISYQQCYPKIVGWKCLLPIPFIWHLFSKDVQLNSDEFKMVDFFTSLH